MTAPVLALPVRRVDRRRSGEREARWMGERALSMTGNRIHVALTPSRLADRLTVARPAYAGAIGVCE